MSLGTMLMKRVVNPVTRAAVRTGVAGRRTTVISYVGRKSGRRLSVPVNFERNGDEVTIVSRRGHQWWRNLVGGADVGLVLDGKVRSGRAEVVEPDDAGGRVQIRVDLAPAVRVAP